MPAVARGDGTDSVASASGSGYLCLSPLTTATDVCSGNVFANSIGVVRKSDPVAVHPTGGCGPENPGLSSYSGSVFANGLNIGRQGDVYSANTITSGSPNVFAGG